MGNWEKPNGHWEWVENERDVTSPIDAPIRPSPSSGDRWGDWVFSSEMKTLTFHPREPDRRSAGYEIRLDEITNSAALAHWSSAVFRLTAGESESRGHQILGAFLHAIENLIGLDTLGSPSAAGPAGRG